MITESYFEKVNRETFRDNSLKKIIPDQSLSPDEALQPLRSRPSSLKIIGLYTDLKPLCKYSLSRRRDCWPIRVMLIGSPWIRYGNCVCRCPYVRKGFRRKTKVEKLWQRTSQFGTAGVQHNARHIVRSHRFGRVNSL